MKAQLPPSAWPTSLRRAIVNIISLARYCWTALDSKDDRAALHREVNLLCEELAIIHARLARMDPRRRPHYTPSERMAILEIKAARGWTSQMTADRFLLSELTMFHWARRCERDDEAFLEPTTPVNKFSDLVRYTAQRLKAFSPRLGKTKIAEMLCRAGVQISPTTVGRILRDPEPPPEPELTTAKRSYRTRAKPGDTWHVDLTAVPSMGVGFWIPWFPYALPQRWPFCWWVAAIVDGCSRKVLGLELFSGKPGALAIRDFLEEARRQVGDPKRLITDQERMFTSKAVAKWCRRHGVRQRLGKVGEKGSLAIIERFFLSLKNECTRRIWVPASRKRLLRELVIYAEWFNDHRPHSSLEGQTPSEVFAGVDSVTPDQGKLLIVPFRGRRHLPVLVRRAA